ncbi:copper homeostasis [Pyrenophora seminiperda CCB06]|uniref:Copper homeostasis protein cutC homolog n=1 Tax=Pyrenophora seminiperda CCB06 TaxID=1302712 RepID=A0A3M7MBZ4_9PLEO|nr:copper homeostasis [Pyrenophora seminiperda CCB06]
MLEIACFNAPSAIAAANAGADRIELCADYAAGGVTPSFPALRQVREETSIPVNVMIRPRGGDFRYSADEFQQMKREMEAFKSLASGFVFGILDSNCRLDKPRNRELVELAAPLPCTFHRAIDEAVELEEAVEAAIWCGFKSILTSGSEKNSLQGAEKLHQLQTRFGMRISVIAGGGVRSTNVQELKRKTGAEWLHSAAITRPGEDVDDEEVRRMQQVLADFG